jgi:methionyl aminopeptidase
MTPLKADEIRKMEKAGYQAAKLLQLLGKEVKAGITTNDLDQVAYDYCMANDLKPATLNYLGYPKSICTSINEVICHGVPDGTKLKDGDIINIDVAIIKDGFYGDNSSMYFVGTPPDSAKKLCDAALAARDIGIEQLGPNATTGDIGFEINKLVTRQGYWVVREIGGHGIGKVFHDDPWVGSFGKKGKGEKLKPWICLTVEPMVNETSAPIAELPIAGSKHKVYITSDKALSAQYEHTILITDTGYQILTLS